jgi:hypothetical protein
MRKIILILGLAVLVLAGEAGWQIASCELSNFELHDDMRFLAVQIGRRIGLKSPSTDEDLRNAVIREAQEYDIDLAPEQVTVRRTGTEEEPIIYLAADYKARVKLFGFPLMLHFTPSSAK